MYSIEWLLHGVPQLPWKRTQIWLKLLQLLTLLALNMRLGCRCCRLLWSQSLRDRQHSLHCRWRLILAEMIGWDASGVLPFYLASLRLLHLPVGVELHRVTQWTVESQCHNAAVIQMSSMFVDFFTFLLFHFLSFFELYLVVGNNKSISNFH